jgi:sporulation protein YlmC with PRC-barrel domain
MTTLDLARDVLDQAILDSEGMLCGRVDDLELQIGKNGQISVHALLVGPGAWAPRLPALPRFIVELFAGTSVVRVPWSSVERVEREVRLRCTAREAGLGAAERRAARWLAWLPKT